MGIFWDLTAEGCQAKGWGSDLGRPWVSDWRQLLLPVFILHKNTAQKQHSTPHELLEEGVKSSGNRFMVVLNLTIQGV